MKQTPNEGVRELILDYFSYDVLAGNILAEDLRENIIKTFTYCYERHLTTQFIARELAGSQISQYRDKVIKRMGSNYNPYPIRLGQIKPQLQRQANESGKSLHGYLLSLLRKEVNQSV